MRKALYDAAGVLKSHGFVEFQPAPGERVRDVEDDFDLAPGQWRWNGVTHTAVPPTSQKRRDAAAREKLVATLTAARVKPTLATEDIREVLADIQEYLEALP